MMRLYSVSREVAEAGIVQECREYAAGLREWSTNALDIGDALRTRVETVCSSSVALSEGEWEALFERVKGISERGLLNQLIWRPEDLARVAEAVASTAQNEGIAARFRYWRQRRSERNTDNPTLRRLECWLRAEVLQGSYIIVLAS